jgi:hypothetical protein
LFVTTLAVVFWAVPMPAQAVTAGPSCGEKLEKNEKGLTINVLFAKNGAVQRYEVVDSKENQEAANDMIVDLQKTYGLAGVNAPPLHIVSFKAGGEGGMMVPDKAIDSCGRTIPFQ